MSESTVVSTSTLVDEISAKCDLSKVKTKEVIEALTSLTAKHVKKGATVRLNGFGSFAKVQRGARQGRNPKTGEAMKIKASKSVKFKAAAPLKAAM